MKQLLLLLLLLLCLSCNKTVKISQLTFNKYITNAYLKDAPFDGVAWSDDEKTICLTCVVGKITSIKVFHENGKVALEGTSLTGDSQLYDDKGKSINPEQFKKEYPHLINAINKMAAKMYCDTKLK